MPHLTLHEIHYKYGIGSFHSTQKMVKRWKDMGEIQPEEHVRTGAHYNYTINAFCEHRFCELIATHRTNDTYSGKIFSKHFRKLSAILARPCETPVKSPSTVP